jgi:hypothetical protein
VKSGESGGVMRNLTLELMKKHNVPLTRQNYLDVEYFRKSPEEIGWVE